MHKVKHYIRVSAMLAEICVITILSPAHSPGHRNTSRDFLLIEPKRPTPRTLTRIRPRTHIQTATQGRNPSAAMTYTGTASSQATADLSNLAPDFLPTAKNGAIICESPVTASVANEQKRTDTYFHHRINNERTVRGRIPLALVWGEQLRVPDHCRRSMIGLAEGIRMYTDLEVSIESHLMLSSPRIHDYPMLVITTDSAFELTRTECENLRSYLENGGFLFVDNAQPNFPHSQAEASMEKMFRDVIGSNARPLPLTPDHEIFNSRFDFTDGAPNGMENNLFPIYARFATYQSYQESAQTNEYSYFLEGYYLKGRCVAVYSDRGYTIKWAGINNLSIASWQWENFEVGSRAPQLKFGVNLAIYALNNHTTAESPNDVALSD